MALPITILLFIQLGFPLVLFYLSHVLIDSTACLFSTSGIVKNNLTLARVIFICHNRVLFLTFCMELSYDHDHDHDHDHDPHNGPS